jgi:hypothetical protein
MTLHCWRMTALALHILTYLGTTRLCNHSFPIYTLTSLVKVLGKRLSDCENNEQIANFVPSSCQGWVNPLHFGLQFSKCLRAVWMQGDEDGWAGGCVKCVIFLSKLKRNPLKKKKKAVHSQGILLKEQRFLSFLKNKSIWNKFLKPQKSLQKWVCSQSLACDSILRSLSYDSIMCGYCDKAIAMGKREMGA